MLDEIAAIAARLPHRAILAIDGVDGAGKTTFGDRLKPLIENLGRQAIRASVDGFHNERETRYRRGKADPMGYFLDSFNYPELKTCLIEPFRSGANVVETSRFDHQLDRPVVERQIAGASAILILDGVFLHRDELWNLWDYSIFLQVPFSLSYQRMAGRDGCDPDPEADSNRRYYQGQLVYLDTCRPEERATLVVNS